ncbi:MAG: hypothetical protein KGH64_03150 [Candidatus Micrarchaeota archaeon]|nr:hypothetical protein [Candidatus Micrarchaeota archaeon]MDE1859404.1 hypothetical protein [Candidatus Micrarchaeota archaeon]
MEYIVSREGIGYSIKGKIDDHHNDALKNVIRQHWMEKLDVLEKAKGSKHVSVALETHLSNMAAITDPIDYEAFCVPNIIQHSRHMGKEDFDTYLKLLESMAIGYSNHLGKDLTGLLLIGITSKGRSISSARRYHTILVNEIGGKVSKYQERINRKTKTIETMSKRLQLHQRSIFRFLKKRKITALAKKINAKHSKMDYYKQRLDQYNAMLIKIKETAKAPPSPSKPSGNPNPKS